MTTLHYTVGLPASGKSTFARNFVSDALAEGHLVVRANRDDIRSMLGITHGMYEHQVTIIQNAIIDVGLRVGNDVIVDDTNFYKGTERRFRKLANRYMANLERHDFTDVPLNVCLSRDALRTGTAHVGEEAIRGMHERYLANRFKNEVG